MPSIIEAPETIEESQEKAAREVAYPVPAPRRGLARMIAAFMSKTVTRRKPRSLEHDLRREDTEMPIDTLARKHPYIYINAMSG